MCTPPNTLYLFWRQNSICHEILGSSFTPKTLHITPLHTHIHSLTSQPLFNFLEGAPGENSQTLVTLGTFSRLLQECTCIYNVGRANEIENVTRPIPYYSCTYAWWLHVCRISTAHMEHTHIYTYTWTWTHIHTCIHTHTVHVHVYTWTRMNTHTLTCKHIHVYTHTHIQHTMLHSTHSPREWLFQ